MIPQKLKFPMNFFSTFPECSLPSSISKNTIKMIGNQVCLRWHVSQNIPKNVFKDGEERSIPSDCSHKEKINFEGFSENGSRANSHSLWRFYFIALTVTVLALLQNKS